MGTIKAVKSFGGKQETRDFNETVWESGAPQRQGWSKIDQNTVALATKLPEQQEIKDAVRTVTEVEVPPQPTVEGADVPTDVPVEAEAEVEQPADDKKKRGPKPSKK